VKLGQRSAVGDILNGSPVATNQSVQIPVFDSNFRIIVYSESSGLSSPLGIAKMLSIQPFVFFRNVYVDTGLPSNVKKSGLESGWEAGDAPELVGIATGDHPEDVEFQFKPVPGQKDMVMAGVSQPLAAGVYRLYLSPPDAMSMNQNPGILFAVEPVADGETTKCADALITYMMMMSKIAYQRCSSAPVSGFDGSAPASSPVVQSAAPIPADCGHDFNACMKNGNQAISSSSWDQAIAFYKQAVQVQPANGNPWLGIGYGDLALGRLTDAKSDLDKGLKLGSQIALNIHYTKNIMSTPEFGSVSLSPTEFRLSLDGKEPLSVPFNQVVANRVGGKQGSQYGSFSFIELVINGKKMRLEFMPLGANCSNAINNDWVCAGDGNGAAQQQTVAQWLFDTINSLSQSSAGTGH
jgi:hypothetical protein